MKTYAKHHFAPWKDRTKGLGGFGKLTVQEGEVYSNCTRCKVHVKCTKTGQTKFWVDGRWVSKRPPCQVSEGP